MYFKKGWISLLAGALLATLQHIAFAQVSGTWINPNGGTWTTSSNWDSHPLIPDGGGTATFGTVWNPVTVFGGGASIQLSAIVIDSPVRYSVGVLSGTLNLMGPAILDVNGLDGIAPVGSPFPFLHEVRVYSASGLTKVGNGAVVVNLSNVSGGVSINGGTIQTGANYPIGSLVSTLTLNGGGLAIDQTAGVSQPIVISPSGGILRAGGVNQNLNAGIDGSGSLLISTSPNLFSPMSAGFSIPVESTFSGAMTIDSGLRLSGTGALLNVSSIAVSNQLLLDSGTTASSNRLSDTAPISLYGATLSGTLNLGSTEFLGPITLHSGLSTIGGSNIRFSTPQVTRTNRAVTGIGTSLVITGGSLPVLAGSGAEGTPDVGILPWARRTSGAAVTVSATGSVRELSAAEYITAIPVGATSSNLKLTANDTVSSPITVNSLSIANPGGGSVTLSGPGPITVSSGGIYLNAAGPVTGSTTIATPLDFGSAEGVIHTPWPPPASFGVGAVVLSGPISGTNGLTIAGGVELRGANTYTGQTTILSTLTLQNNVLAGVPGFLGADTSPVVIEGGANPAGILFPKIVSPVLFERDLIIRRTGVGSVAIQNTASASDPIITFSGDIQLDGSLSLQGIAVTGNISGSGSLHASYSLLSGTNTFSGGVVSNSSISVGSDNALGTGKLWMPSDSSQIAAINGLRTIANPVMFTGNGAAVYGSQPIHFTGPIDLGGSTRSIIFRNSATTTFSGRIYNGGLTKLGTGLLQVTNIRLPSLTVGGGVLKILPNGTDSGTSRVQTLSVGGPAVGVRLDLTDNDLIIDYLSASPLATLQNYLDDGTLFSLRPWQTPLRWVMAKARYSATPPSPANPSIPPAC